jgi:hypothetical protein
MNIEQSSMRELPGMPPPSFAPLFLVVSYYVGPGWTSRSWKIHHEQFKRQPEAEAWANKLPRWNIHRRIVRIG